MLTSTKRGRAVLALTWAFMFLAAACGGSDRPAAETAEAPAAETAGTSADATAGGDNSSAAGEGEAVRIAYLAGFTNHDWARAGIDSAKAEAAELGAEVEVFDAQGDPNRQYSQVQDVITTGRFDGIVIMTLDGAGIVPAIEEAVAEGLAVVDYAFPVGTDLDTREPQVEGMTGSVVISPAENGRTIGQIIVDACGTIDEQPCEVALLPGSLTVSADAARVREIEAMLGDRDDVNLVAVEETGYTTDGAFGVAQDLLVANPGLDMFAAIGSESVEGAERAVIDAGREGEILLGGGACSTGSAEAVREGRVYACYRGTPIEDNAKAVEMIVQTVRGEEVADRSPNPGEEAGWPEIITADNIGDREGQWTD